MFLILCPATLLRHWIKELHQWSPHLRSVILHDISPVGKDLCKKEELYIESYLRKISLHQKTKGLVVVTTYDGLRTHKDSLTHIEWTAVGLDEGQKLKNPETHITRICKSLPCYHRLVLSGTPIQNSLKELWSIFDFVYPGRLGSQVVFELEFANPIRIGGYSNATKLQSEIANQTAAILQRIVKPYILRRKKETLQHIVELPKKTEQILFCKLTMKQSDVYDTILASPEVQLVLQKKMTAFSAMNNLRKICNHPSLLYKTSSVNGKRHIESIKNVNNDEEDDDDCLNPNMSYHWNDSGKLIVLSRLLPLWYQQGNKVLLFSQTRAMLDLIEIMIKEMQFRYLRLDGTTSIQSRASLIDNFNNEKEIFIMLLTTRTGGLGISLTSANRVVLVDPDWNPMLVHTSYSILLPNYLTNLFYLI